MKKNLIFSGGIALLVSLISFGILFALTRTPKTVKIEHITQPMAQSARLSDPLAGDHVSFDFTATAERVVGGVVHIKSTRMPRQTQDRPQANTIPEPFRDFFNEPFWRNNPAPQNRMPEQGRVGTGSGVIISEDGYIVTNNHVIDQADDIEVTLYDNRNYKAIVIGTDPTTDLALLQIKEKNLPNIPFGDSDKTKVGQWVLAVGNPFSLNSTVTAGIISAKGRSINILREQYAVENFIQTDAAINPGNSGGALVNLEGALVGINTAIASQNGVYNGYGFAVPSKIVTKVVDDLLQYGMVQRGVLGVMIRSVDGNFAKEKDLDINQGVFVDSLLENSAAGSAGVKPGDVIVAVDGTNVKTASDLQGIIARHRPGETVQLNIDRKGSSKLIDVVLKNRKGKAAFNTNISSKILRSLGAELESINEELAGKLDIKGGVKVTQLYAGKIRRQTQMREGFIITSINGKAVNSVEDMTDTLERVSGGVMFEGIYEDLPGTHYYAIGINEN